MTARARLARSLQGASARALHGVRRRADDARALARNAKARAIDVWESPEARAAREKWSERAADAAWRWKLFRWRVLEPACAWAWDRVRSCTGVVSERLGALNSRAARALAPHADRLHRWSAEHAERARRRRDRLASWWASTGAGRAARSLRRFAFLLPAPPAEWLAGNGPRNAFLALSAAAIIGGWVWWRLTPAPAPGPTPRELELLAALTGSQ